MSAVPGAGRRSAITGALVLDALRERAEPATLVIEAGRITGVLAPGAAVGADTEKIDATGKLLIPGLINPHTHGHGAISKGLGDRWTLELSLVAGPWVAGNRSTEAKYLSAALGAAEMLLKGCTACYDLVYEFPVPSPEGLDAIGQAYFDSGMRAVIAPMIADRSFYDAIPGVFDALPPELQAMVGGFKLEPMERSLAACEAAFRGWAFPRERVRPAIAPTIPLHCSEPFMLACRDIATRHGIGMHMHLSESKVQAVAALRSYGKTLAAFVDDLGLLGPDFTGAHAIWMDRADYDRFAARGASLAHMPASNFRLGSGLAKVRAMLEAGVNVGVATDGCTSSDNLNLFEAMRLASFVSRAHGLPHGQWLSSREAFHMATIGAARAAGLQDLCGRIAPGFAADLVFIDLAHINYLPANDLLNQVVNVEDGTAVEHVMVDGRFAVRDRKLVSMDLEALRGRINDTAAALLEATQPLKRNADRISPHVAAFCRTLIEQAHPFNRYAGIPGQQAGQ